MSITVPRTNGNSASTGNIVPTLGTAPTDGNLLALFIAWNHLFSGITAPAGWIEAIHIDNTSSNFCAAIYYKWCSSEGTSWTFTTSASTNWGCDIVELAGCDPTTPFDKYIQNDSGVTTLHSGFQAGGPLTPARPGEFIIGGVSTSGANGGTETCDDAAYTISASDGSRALGVRKLKLITDIADENPTFGWTTNQKAIGLLGAFQPVARTGKVKEHNGSSFVAKPVKTSAGTTKPAKYFNGTGWVTLP